MKCCDSIMNLSLLFSKTDKKLQWCISDLMFVTNAPPDNPLRFHFSVLTLLQFNYVSPDLLLWLWFCNAFFCCSIRGFVCTNLFVQKVQAVVTNLRWCDGKFKGCCSEHLVLYDCFLCMYVGLDQYENVTDLFSQQTKKETKIEDLCISLNVRVIWILQKSHETDKLYLISQRTYIRFRWLKS